MKAESQWPAGEDWWAALTTSGSTMPSKMPTLCNHCLRCGDLHSQGSQSGAMVQLDYAMDDGDQKPVVSGYSMPKPIIGSGCIKLMNIK